MVGRRGGVWYVALGNGLILRLSDGKYVWTDGSKNHDHVGVGSPIFLGDAFCWMSHAVQLPATEADEPKLLWQLDTGTVDRIRGSRRSQAEQESKPFTMRGLGWHDYASPVLHDGVIYSHQERGRLSGIDARTGKWLFTREIVFRQLKGRCGGQIYPSLTLAGDLLFAVSGRGTMVLKLAGKGEPEPVAECAHPPLGGNMLVFRGRQVLVHAESELHCYTGRTGRSVDPRSQ